VLADAAPRRVELGERVARARHAVVAGGEEQLRRLERVALDGRAGAHVERLTELEARRVRALVARRPQERGALGGVARHAARAPEEERAGALAPARESLVASALVGRERLVRVALHADAAL